LNELILLEINLAALNTLNMEIERNKEQTKQSSLLSSNNKIEAKIWVNKDTLSHNTRCMVCNSNCHENCSLTETKEKGSDIFKSCLAFSGNNCKCGHHYTYHVHLKSIWVEKSLSIQIPYNKKVEPKDEQKILEFLQSEKTSITKQIAGKEEEIGKQILKLKEICNKFNFQRELNLAVKILVKSKCNKTDVEQIAIDEAIKSLKRLLVTLFKTTQEELNDLDQEYAE